MNKKWIISIGVLVSVIFLFYIANYNDNPDIDLSKKIDTNTVASTTMPVYNATTTNNKINKMDKNRAKISTSMGDIVIEFNSGSPKTVENFKTLMGKGFYDGVRFHRVIKDFMIQTGDPNSKDTTNIAMWGMGGPGYKFADELSGSEKYTYGTVAMANSGPNTNGSQFFIVSAKSGAGLKPDYTVFAHVVSGMNIVDQIQNVKTTAYPVQPTDRPLTDVMVNKVVAE